MLGSVITKAFILAKENDRISAGSFVIMDRLAADSDNSKKRVKVCPPARAGGPGETTAGLDKVIKGIGRIRGKSPPHRLPWRA
jgi:hypothetical protein